MLNSVNVRYLVDGHKRLKMGVRTKVLILYRFAKTWNSVVFLDIYLTKPSSGSIGAIAFVLILIHVLALELNYYVLEL